MSIPDPVECRELLRQKRVPLHIQRHSERVALVSLRLAVLLERHGDQTVDRPLVEAAALLHDIAKADCLGNRRDHALEGGQVLRSLGLGSVAELVERHVDLGEWLRTGRVTEAELLNYSDKRVRHEQVVTLSQRFHDLIERYARGNLEAERRIRRNWHVMEELERKIFRDLPLEPDELGDHLAQAPSRPEPEAGLQ